MQAFGDAPAAHGTVRTGEDVPPNRRCVSCDHGREGYNKAAILVEQIEQHGVVARATHVGERETVVKER
jgi:hypothetical protein